MNFRIPIYVFQHKAGYTARPLFFAAPERTDANLNRLLTKLTRDLVELLEVLGRKERHDPLAAWAFCPPVTAHRTTVEIELRRRVARVKYLLLAFDHMGRRLAFCPAVPDLWFEVTRGEALEVRAQAVYTEHWRTVERDADAEEDVRPEARLARGQGVGAGAGVERERAGRRAGEAGGRTSSCSAAARPATGRANSGASGGASTGCTRTNSTAPSSATAKWTNCSDCSDSATGGRCCCAGRGWSARPRSFTSASTVASRTGRPDRSSGSTRGSCRRSG